MDVADYGAVSLLTSMGVLVAVLLGGALDQAVFRWTIPSRFDELGRSVIRSAWWWLAIWVPLICILGGLALWLLDMPILQISSRLWALEVVAAGFNAFVSSFALPQARAQQALQRFVTVAGTYIVSLLAGKTVLVIVFQGGPWGWVFSDLFAALLSFAVGVSVSQRPLDRITRAGVRRVLRFSVPLLPHVVSFWALSALTRPLIALSLPLSAVGVFSASFNAASVGLMILAEVNRATAVEYSRDKFPAPSSETAKAIRLQYSMAFAVAVVICLSAPLYTHFVLPPVYSEALPLLVVLSLASVFYGLYLIPMNFIVQTAGVTKWSWVGSSAGTVVILLGALWGGAIGGLMTVAIVNVAGYAVMCASAIVLLRAMKLEVKWAQGGITPATALPLVVGLSFVMTSQLIPIGIAWSVTGAFVGSALIIAAIAWQYLGNPGTSIPAADAPA